MQHKFANQYRPLSMIFRCGDVGTIMENGLLARRQRGGHETELYKWLHAYRKEKVEYLIGVKKRVEKCVALADQRAHIVREYAVKAHVPDAKFGMRTAYLRLPIRAQRERGMATADGMLPEMGKRRGVGA